jgi:hypothetical protein
VGATAKDAGQVDEVRQMIDPLLLLPKLTIPENNSNASIRVYGKTIELAETRAGG